MDVQGADMNGAVELLFQLRGGEGGEVLVVDPDPSCAEQGQKKNGEDRMETRNQRSKRQSFRKPSMWPDNTGMIHKRKLRRKDWIQVKGTTESLLLAEPQSLPVFGRKGFVTGRYF